MRLFDPHLLTQPVRPAAAKLSIAVVGAGAAGLTMAVELRRHGFDNVVVYEASERVGGRSSAFEFGGVTLDLGTAAFSKVSYRMIARLVAQTGTATVTPPAFSLMDVDGRFLPRALPSRLAVLRYLRHWCIWRMGLMPDAGSLAVSCVDWLRGHGLAAFIGDNTLFFTGRSMHYFRPSVSMIDFFRWFRPSTLVSGLFPSSITRLPGSFFGLWKAVVRHYGIDVRLGTPVRQVQTWEGGPRVDGQRFDAVVVATPLGTVASPLDAVVTAQDVRVDRAVSKVWLVHTTDAGLASLCSYSAVYADPLTYRVHEIPDDPAHKLLYTNQYATADGAGDCDDVADRTLKRLGLAEARLLTTVSCPYFPRFSPGAIRAGRAAQVSAVQGLGKIWYTGSLLSHYNLESIHRFNYDLANQIRDSVEQRSLASRLHARAVAFLNSL